MIDDMEEAIKDVSDELIKNLTTDFTLRILNVGTDPVNYKILTALPSTVDNIMILTNLTKVPVNRRLNDLERYGLLKREYGTGKVNPTSLTQSFMVIIASIEEQIKANIGPMLKNLTN